MKLFAYSVTAPGNRTVMAGTVEAQCCVTAAYRAMAIWRFEAADVRSKRLTIKIDGKQVRVTR